MDPQGSTCERWGGGGGEVSNWRGVSIFYLWDIAFDESDLPKIFANIADAIPGGKELLLVTSIRYPLRRSMLEEHVKITKVGEQVTLKFYKNSKSTSLLQIYTIARKHKSNEPGGAKKSNQPGGAKLLDTVSPFFANPGSRIRAYEMLANTLKTPPCKRTRATAASRSDRNPRACSATTTVTAVNPSPLPDPLHQDDIMKHAHIAALPAVDCFAKTLKTPPSKSTRASAATVYMLPPVDFTLPVESPARKPVELTE